MSAILTCNVNIIRDDYGFDGHYEYMYLIIHYTGIIYLWKCISALDQITMLHREGFMYSADADGRGHFFLFFFIFYFLACIDLRAQLERDPGSDRLGHPPPHTHHDPMKIYRVYRYLHAQKYTPFVDLHV